MPVYEFASDAIRRLDRTTFSSAQMQERRDLQRLLRANIGVISDDTLIIAEEFGHWDDSRRRIDLLGIDKDAKLVVIELKRTEDGGHIELQAIRYAAMISTMTFDQAVGVYETYLEQIGQREADARTGVLEFLGWEEPDEDAFAQDVRIVLASAEFSREVTTSVLWLNDRGIDIRCVRLQPYALGGRVLVDVQQIIPLPEVAEYQVRVAEKKRKERDARTDTRDWTSYDLSIGAIRFSGLRKRHVIYQVFRALVARGVDPEAVAAQCGARASRALISVAGDVNGEKFYELAQQARMEEGKTFDPKRYFGEEGELVHHGERTYAFSSQWGGDAWLQAMNQLKDTFPEEDIRFSPRLPT